MVDPREFALEFCEARSKSGIVYASQNPSVTVQKQHTVLFFHCVRFPSSYYRAKLKERDKTLSFNFGGPEGNSLLNFARQGAKGVKFMPRKILRSPFKNSALCCFFTAFDSPHIIYPQRKREEACCFLFNLVCFV